MKRLWRGEDVTFEGTYSKLTGARMGFTPCQRPHPPRRPRALGAHLERRMRPLARCEAHPRPRQLAVRPFERDVLAAPEPLHHVQRLLERSEEHTSELQS